MPVERDFPRAAVRLEVMLQGQTDPLVAFVIPRKVEVTRRNHTQADTANIEIDGTEIPFDPRTIDSAAITVHMAQASSAEAAVNTWATPSAARFVGYVDMFENEQQDDDVLSLKARDLSSVFRDCKPIPVAAVPLYTDTLYGAVRRIIANVPGGPALTLDASGAEDVPLSSLMPQRHAGAIQLKRDMSAWEVLEYIAGMAARGCNVFLDKLRLPPVRVAFDNQTEPELTLSWNTSTSNTSKIGVEKKFVRNRKGIKAVCWDAAHRRRLEADWPSDADLPNRRTPRVGGARGGGAQQPPERDVYVVPGVQTQESLTRVAQGIWAERSRQELSVSVDTPYFSSPFLDVRNGARVRFQLNRAIAAGVMGTGSQGDSRAVWVNRLMRRLSISRDAAGLLLDAALHPGADIFYVHEATLQWAAEGDIGVRLHLINLIGLDVDTLSGRTP